MLNLALSYVMLSIVMLSLAAYKNIARDKHSSLFCLLVSDEDKTSHNVDASTTTTASTASSSAPYNNSSYISSPYNAATPETAETSQSPHPSSTSHVTPAPMYHQRSDRTYLSYNNTQSPGVYLSKTFFLSSPKKGQNKLECLPRQNEWFSWQVFSGQSNIYE